MKDLRGWLAFGIFCAACLFIGFNRFLMRSLNPTILAMLVISVVIVLVLNPSQGPKGPSQKDGPDQDPDDTNK